MRITVVTLYLQLELNGLKFVSDRPFEPLPAVIPTIVRNSVDYVLSVIDIRCNQLPCFGVTLWTVVG